MAKAGRRALARGSTRVDRDFVVRTACVPDGRRLWVVLEAQHDGHPVRRDVSSLRLALSSGDTTHEFPLEAWSGPVPVTLSASIELAPLVERDQSARRVEVRLVDGRRRSRLRLSDPAALSTTDRFSNTNVPDPGRALQVVPIAGRGETLAIEVRTVPSRWAAGTTCTDGTFTVHGRCVPADAPPPSKAVLSDSTAPAVELDVRPDPDGRWSASAPVATITAAGAAAIGDDMTTWTVTVDGEPLLRRPAPARTAALVRPQWDVRSTERSGRLSSGFRRGGILTVELEWSAPEQSADTAGGAS